MTRRQVKNQSNVFNFSNDFEKKQVMGGLGSGRPWGQRRKKSTDDFRSIDIRLLKKYGYLECGTHLVRWSSDGKESARVELVSNHDRLMLNYKVKSCFGSEWAYVSLPIDLSWTDCNLGGQRPWFICPVPSCGKRVAILYGAEVFVCRHCLHLSYGSQYEDQQERACRMAFAIREKLGWKGSVLDGLGNKPASMHHAKFQQLSSKYRFLLIRAGMNCLDE